ncbi:MAG: response regulator [Ignavibacteriaceae bacterium]|nr:response regulator [Ignavibacteriaceae bacterium]
MKKQILIIDDNTSELKKLRELLSQNGYGVLTATDEEIAKILCSKIPIDFVLVKKTMTGVILDSTKVKYSD